MGSGHLGLGIGVIFGTCATDTFVVRPASHFGVESISTERDLKTLSELRVSRCQTFLSNWFANLVFLTCSQLVVLKYRTTVGGVLNSLLT